MIYDCFTFFNELDLLEIRLNILNEVVDRFVLVEATRTHRGAEKPLHFNENKNRFAPFLDKIIHVIVDDYTPVENYIAKQQSDTTRWSWAYENFQRHNILRGLRELQDGDTLIVSDLDEIPTADAVRKAASLATDGKVRLIQLDQRSYYLNFRNYSAPNWWLGPMALSGKAFRNHATYRKVRAGDTSIREILPIPTTQLVRAMKPDGIIRHGGWHFSFLGGCDKIAYKLRQFAHSEYSSKEFTSPTRIQAILENGGDLFKLGDRYYGCSPEKCLPSYILNNTEKYKTHIFPTTQSYLGNVRTKKINASIFYAIRTITPQWVKRIYFRLNSHRTIQ